ncbi:MAG: HAMP domain-containing sensor histidine kinase [Anaerovorax sp.]
MKIKADFKSLKFKLWAYFALFAALLMLILWFLQIFFLNTYYEEMKISETRKIANDIVSEYGQKDFFQTIDRTLAKSDFYIHVETGDGTIMFSPYPNSKNYINEMMAVKKQLLSKSTIRSTSIIIPDSNSNTNTLAYGAILDPTPGNMVILYLFSPLYPVNSTVGILINQLIYVTVISLLLAFALSIYLSKRITKPIVNITDSATKLAEGQYGITFEGGQYSEIMRLADTLTYTSKELAKADDLQKDLIANVSHDLRTPLTMVKSYAEMIRDISGNIPEKREHHLQVIIDEADRLNFLVNDLMELSKMQSGVASLSIKEFNLKGTVESLLNAYSIFAENENYQLNLNSADEIWIKGDEARLKQVITNLLNNAIRYSSDSKKISVTLTQKKGITRCEITDSGQGIEESELAHIWDRYYKASSNHSRTTTGTGLGLSIVKEILILHNAQFGVESQVGCGSTFWFELPS